ncbi:hypothetical protein PHMEG_0002995 [Phytophthora megakarya]|uniref:Uncharacterized protein n=1 Tax=Phytophthora megakarya TaxID=4795 RepID=A0A225WX58_9STRA|nr:hypothetical protein PHMEG_0002995 [Phytophthora megakarya]
MTCSIASLKERFKVYETTAKDQITKLEVEVKVANAQLREITYVNKDNSSQIDQLTKSLSLSEKEITTLKIRIVESEKHVAMLQSEKEDLQRNKTALDVANSSSKDTLHRFIRSLQNMLALVKLDEFPLDEAIRELLLMVHDTFGKELNIDSILDEDDKPIEIELEVPENITAEEHASWERRASTRRKGIVGTRDVDEEAKGSLTSRVAEASSAQSELIRMSRFRKSKLDHLVKKLQRDIELKVELITNLESAVVEQTRQISHLTTTTRQQARVIERYDCQKGMLQSDVEMTRLMLLKVRSEKQSVEFTLEQARIDQVLQTNRAFQAEVALATLRHEFDMHVIVNEDLMAKIWRKYEYDLYMRSLRRNKEVQATVTVVDQPSQTLVPQRNPAMERPRIASQYMPSNAPGSSETLLQKISRATRELLPDVAHEMDQYFTVAKAKRSPKHQHNRESLVRPLASSPRSSRMQLGAQVSNDECRRRHPGKQSKTAISEAGESTLPQLDDASAGLASSPSQMIHHVNEYGNRQNVHLSSARPPFFTNQSPKHASTLSPRPPVTQSPRSHKAVPRKLDKNVPFNHVQFNTQYEERCQYSTVQPELLANRHGSPSQHGIE